MPLTMPPSSSSSAVPAAAPIMTVESFTKQMKDTRSLYLRGKSEFDSKEYMDAVKTFNDVAQRQEAMLGKYHKETVKTYWRLGKCCCKAGLDSKALVAFQRSARMANSAFGSTTSKLLQDDIESCWKLSFPHRSTALDDMYSIFVAEQSGDALFKSKDYQGASESYIKALDIQSSLFDERQHNNNDSSSSSSSSSTLDAADIRMKLGQCYLQISPPNKLADAEIVLQKSHECYIKMVGKDHPATYSSIASMRKLKTLSGRSLGGGGISSKFGWLQNSLSSLGSSTKSNNNGNNGGTTTSARTSSSGAIVTTTTTTTAAVPITTAASASSE